MTENLEGYIVGIADEAKAASIELSNCSIETRNNALLAMASSLRDNKSYIIQENAKDMKLAEDKGTSPSILDRLMLDDDRIEDMASALEDLVSLEDPLRVIQLERTLYNDIRLKRISVPLGVVGMIYEARPNVTSDAIGICLKSGNACILRGGSLALNSSKAIADTMAQAAYSTGISSGAIQYIDSTDRAAADIMMSLHGVIDVVIPRGGSSLIQHCVDTSKVPVIETGTGNCHVYVHSSADIEMAHRILINSKCRRLGVCNACETLLVDSDIARAFLPIVMNSLIDKGITMHCDEPSMEIAREYFEGVFDEGRGSFEEATQSDWETEYLGPHIAIKCVGNENEAIAHINEYGTKHSESIVAEDIQAQSKFQDMVDAAAVYVNAPTSFTDGGQFGLGAEIGISTQKLHVRGPFALEALTSYKYVLNGNGQIRE